MLSILTVDVVVNVTKTLAAVYIFLITDWEIFFSSSTQLENIENWEFSFFKG